MIIQATLKANTNIAFRYVFTVPSDSTFINTVPMVTVSKGKQEKQERDPLKHK